MKKLILLLLFATSPLWASTIVCQESLEIIRDGDKVGRFEDAWRRHVDIEGFPVCHIDDIIASKAATNRQKDRESLPRLRSFREYWLRNRR